jgi:hypothetical protein
VEGDGEGKVQAMDQLGGHQVSPVSGRTKGKEEASASKSVQSDNLIITPE